VSDVRESGSALGNTCRSRSHRKVARLMMQEQCVAWRLADCYRRKNGLVILKSLMYFPTFHEVHLYSMKIDGITFAAITDCVTV